MMSVGRHCRWPRSYRGKDILWWVDQMGALQAEASHLDEMKSPGPQLTGSQGHEDINLYLLHHRYHVQINGKVTNVTSERIDFDQETLVRDLKDADDNCNKLLEAINAFANKHGLNGNNTPSLAPPPGDHEDRCPRLSNNDLPKSDSIDLSSENLVCVIWATGFGRTYPFLSESLTKELWDPEHQILRNEGGVTTQCGLYVLGYRWMRRKHSNFVDGVGDDARDLAQHIRDRS